MAGGARHPTRGGGQAEPLPQAAARQLVRTGRAHRENQSRELRCPRARRSRHGCTWSDLMRRLLLVLAAFAALIAADAPSRADGPLGSQCVYWVPPSGATNAGQGSCIPVIPGQVPSSMMITGNAAGTTGA